MKLNCWEFKDCGYETSGVNSFALGACPAFTEQRLNGVHGGINGGRACWVVSGTLCGGCAQGGYAKKILDCRECEFFHRVNAEEGEHVLRATTLLDMLG